MTNTRIRKRLVLITLAALWIAAFSPAVPAQEDEELPPEIQPKNCLMLPAAGRSGRSAIHTDAIEARIVAGTFAAPRVGDKVAIPGKSDVAWVSVEANDKGVFPVNRFVGGYAFFSVKLPEDETLILEASGHGLVYVNGEIRAGDPYGYGWLMLPVELREGENRFLFRLGRKPLKFKLVRSEKTVFFNLRDRTLPHAIVGQTIDAVAGVVVVNARDESLRGFALAVTVNGGPQRFQPVSLVTPLGFRKIVVPLRGPAPAADQKTVRVEMRLVRRGPRGRGVFVQDSADIDLVVRRPDQTHQRTFVSSIDGSAQAYAVNPATHTDEARPKALVLTLHGASVKAMNQVNSYAPKSWCHVVAPTNRRPFGFDWEDWGRWDALEVLDLAQKTLGTDPKRTYLTGHSMGGHGAWHVGVTFPDRFAVVAPSAGWVSFWSYAGATSFKAGDGIAGLLRRAASPSHTLALVRNLAPRAVYVLHGAKDDNVPVAQARIMKKELEAFHRDFHYHEQPGVKHWWDASKDPGTSCVDWPPMFALFQKRSLPEASAVHEIDFRTASPGVSARHTWLTIEAQEHMLTPSRVAIRFDPEKKRVEGTTENVARLALDLAVLDPEQDAKARFIVKLDDTTLTNVARPGGVDGTLYLVRTGSKWEVGSPAPAAHKGPHRYGPFKEVFKNRVVLTYATDGSDEENAWAYARARYDAETFAYRGNGSMEVVADVAFDPRQRPDCNVVLYGYAGNHTLWSDLLGTSPVQVKEGSIRIGSRELKGENLACLFVRPRSGNDTALVGVVAGTGPAGRRLTDRLPYFVSGVAYPDLFVADPTMLESGIKGVRMAGFFGADWSVEQGEFAE